MPKLRSVPEWLAPIVVEKYESVADTVSSGAFVFYHPGDAEISLDGKFTADELRDLARLMDDNKSA